MWGIFLSEPLDIVGTVGRYPAVYLMPREPIRNHRNFQYRIMRYNMLWDIRHRFQRGSPSCGQVAHVLRTLPPVAAIVLLRRAAPRLACVKPAASVHPEPGSNSSLYILYIFSLMPGNFLESTFSNLKMFGTCFVLVFHYYQ